MKHKASAAEDDEDTCCHTRCESVSDHYISESRNGKEVSESTPNKILDSATSDATTFETDGSIPRYKTK